MAEMFVDPIMEKIINAGFRFLKDQVSWQAGMKEELVKLQENLPKIQAVINFASSQGPIPEEYRSLYYYLLQLRDATADADDVVDELEYMEFEKQLTKNKKMRRARSIMKSMNKRFIKISKRALKTDPTLKRLKEAVQVLCRISTYFARLYDNYDRGKDAKQKHLGQQFELYRACETGSSRKNDLIGRGKEKELVMEWLRNPSNEHRESTLYGNISLLSIVGIGGMGKTTLLQHVYEDEITKEFDLKMWVCVSNSFDVKKVIADMLESLKTKEMPRLDTLDALQGRLKEEVMGKKFLLVLDDVWEEEEERDKSKWEYVLAPLAFGDFGSKIIVTTRADSVALMFAGVIKKKTEIVKLEGLEDDECLQILYYHAFAGVKNSNDHEDLRKIARNKVKKLLGFPLATKMIGGLLNEKLDKRHWREVLRSDLLDQNSINFILRLGYKYLPYHLKNCFAFCCKFPQGHSFDKDDLVRMWIALGFIQPSQKMTTEDIGRKYYDVLVNKTFFDKVGDNYKVNVLIHQSASHLIAWRWSEFLDDEQSFHIYIEHVRHLFVQTIHPNILEKIEKIKHLQSLFLFDKKITNEDLCSALIEIFKASRSLRLLYVFAPSLKMIPEEIENLVHLRYLKIDGYNLTMMPRSLSKLYHLQYLIYDTLGFPSQPEVDDFLPNDITNLSNLHYISIDYGIPMLRELPNLPPSLKLLSIWKCLPELKERYGKDGGFDFYKIAHIPHVFIGP